jgi:uncharacterized membrane protein
MSTRLTTILIAVLIAATVLAGVVLYPRLPDPMASHWNFQDEVDGHMTRFWGVFMMPIITAAIVGLFLVIPSIDPLRANISRFRPTFNAFILLMVLFLGYIWKLSILWNLGYRSFRMSTAIMPAMGLLFIFIAHLLRMSKRNWFIGIRTPWTLSSDAVWDATHRLGSVLFLVAGILALLGSLFGKYAYLFTLVPVITVTVVLVIYSYVVFQREARSQ